MDWHALQPAELLRRLEADGRGLSEAEARRRLERFGPNALKATRPTPLLVVFLRQFLSPLVYLLIAAALLAFFLGERTDGLVILVVVVLNAAIGAFQEQRAARSMAALRRVAELRVRVRRDGADAELAASALVPGDVVILAPGDAVAADARLLEAVGLEVAEAALTGESLPVAKEACALPADTLLAERRNLVHAGTFVSAGSGRAIVVATAEATQVGHIAALTGAVSERHTPLERRIAAFGRFLLRAALALFGLIVLLGLARGLPRAEVLLIATSQLVSMVPEGLPVAVTVALAVGMQRMARRRAIVRRLRAVESLGSTTVICTDKTGTLTRNEMTVTSGWLPGAGRAEWTGESLPAPDPAFLALVEAGVLCNDADRGVGDPLERALLELGPRVGIDPAALRARLPRRGAIPFSAARRWMATAHAEPGGGTRIAVKGAPEALREWCAEFPDTAQAALAEMAGEALRVLALAELRIDGPAPGDLESLRGGARLLGLVGILDPPREEAAAAVERCRRAGIRPVMVTGDLAATGLAIARRIGLAGEGDRAVDGRELKAMDAAALAAALDSTAVFARIEPADKRRIVEAFQARGEVVAMTGDGVNDAPALARADVGIAMGRSGTEVAKEAADIVITDDNFSTIVAAVEEGRLAGRNLRKVILLLVASGVAEVLVLVAALVLGLPLPFAAVQILWNNVVTEGTIALSLVFEPAEGDEMSTPPPPRDEPILGRTQLRRLALMSLAIAAVTLAFFGWKLASGVALAEARTATFTLLAVCEWFNVLNCRSAARSVLRAGVGGNRWLGLGLLLSSLLQFAVVYLPLGQRLFHTVPLPLSDVFLIGAAGSLVLWIEELRKWRVRAGSPA